MHFKRFDEAEGLYLKMDRANLAIEMRMRLGATTPPSALAVEEPYRCCKVCLLALVVMVAMGPRSWCSAAAHPMAVLAVHGCKTYLW